MGLASGKFQEVFLPGLGQTVGLCGDEWVTQGPGGTLAPLTAAPFPGLVTVLEFTPHTFTARLEAGLLAAHLSVHHAESFPVLTAIRLGLGWQTDYWEALALDWVATLGLEVDYQVVAMEGWDPDAAPGRGWPLGERTWINPSPNAPNLWMARCYAGTVMLEGTTLSASGVNQWLGIPFAAPPVGDLRWRAPADPPINDTLQTAQQFAPSCIGTGQAPNSALNEDCLYLSVFAPSNATTTSNLPVWFFIQGGGYAADSDQDRNGTEVVMKSNHSIVFVEINYRVGAFGFLAGQEVSKDGHLNVGLLDQRK